MDKQKTADEKIKELEVQLHTLIRYTLKYTQTRFTCSVCSGVSDYVLWFIFILQQKKVYLERSVKEAEDNIREMLMSRRTQWSISGL